MVSKVFEKLVNNRLLITLRNIASFLISSMVLTVVCDRITSAFNRSGATRVVTLPISKGLDRVRYAGLLHKLRSYGI